jgi:hypothetical protein
MQKVWDILLDQEFLEAYEHGFVMMCLDGVVRRFYPRIFTYSADYPEKYVFSFALSEHLSVSLPECFSLPFVARVSVLALVA